MLKTITKFPDHESVIDSAKLFTRWLYNHEKLHTMMKIAIGGNLVRWNATCFGMNYLFLDKEIPFHAMDDHTSITKVWVSGFQC
jgi:hypothetical protein